MKNIGIIAFVSCRKSGSFFKPSNAEMLFLTSENRLNTEGNVNKLMTIKRQMYSRAASNCLEKISTQTDLTTKVGKDHYHRNMHSNTSKNSIKCSKYPHFRYWKTHEMAQV